MKQDCHDRMATLAAPASNLELLQLRTALDHPMFQPVRSMAIRRQLHVGQVVDYLDVRANQLPGCAGQPVAQGPGDRLPARPGDGENVHDLARRWMP